MLAMPPGMHETPGAGESSPQTKRAEIIFARFVGTRYIVPLQKLSLRRSIFHSTRS